MEDRPPHVDSEGGALRRAKALSATSRVEILSRLRSAAAPLTAGALAAALGIHHTAVRQHLALLVDAGLVRSLPMPVEGRGRPSTGYVIGGALEGDAYRELAGMLAEAVRTGRTARAAGREAGLRVAPKAGGSLATLSSETERLGFRPELRTSGEQHQLVLGACPFAELATAQPETVCELHVGLAEGIVERSGGLHVDGIRLADPAVGGCRIMLRQAAAGPAT